MNLNLPRLPGTYVLLVALDKTIELQIGRLGAFTFSPGYYAYVGSARGSGGLSARLQRHLHKRGKRHWHIDYLRAATRVENLYCAASPLLLECLWAQAISRLPAAHIPAPGFGSSDCIAGCPAHLIHFPVSVKGEIDQQIFFRIQSVTPPEAAIHGWHTLDAGKPAIHGDFHDSS